MASLRQLVVKGLPCTRTLGLRTARVVSVRSQSTSAAVNATETSKPATSKKPEVKKSNRRQGPQLNSKLRDISLQIRRTIDENLDNVSESTQILEEGLSYLRDIQHAEGIKEETIYSLFQPLLVSLLEKTENSEGSKGLSELLEIFMRYNVAHTYHFTKAAIHELKTNNDKALAYQEVLRLWVKYLEYTKTSNNKLNTRIYKVFRKLNYNTHDLRNLVFYAFVQSCILQGVKYDFKDAIKLLQSDDLPEVFQIRRTIVGQGLIQDLRQDFDSFTRDLDKINLESLDPNGSFVLNKINTYTSHKDVNALNRIYNQVQDASKKNDVPIHESTLIRFMSAFYECGQHESVFLVFQLMIQSGIEKPSVSSWDFVIRSMGHPSHIEKFNESQKNEIANNIERMIETIEAGGSAITAKTLSVIVGSFANLNRFDKVDHYLEKYATGKNKLPIIFTTKNNILIGLLLNNNVKEAEKKLKEFMDDGSDYVPSSTTMNSFINFYAKSSNFKAVEGILNFMKQNNIPTDVGTFTILTDVFFKLHRERGLVPDVSKLLQSFSETAGNVVDINEVTIATIIDGLVKDGINLDAARALFSHLKTNKVSPQTLTSMMKGELDHGSIINAEVLFQRYISNIRNDARIWNLMINSLVAKNENLALDYFRKFKEQTRCEPNFFTYYFLITHFLKRSQKKTVQYLIDELAKSDLKDLGNELPKILKVLSQNYEIPEKLLHQISK